MLILFTSLFASAQTYQVAPFSDTFSAGKLDTSRWIASDGKAPGTKGRHEGTFSPSNLDFSQGMLRLTVTQKADGAKFVSQGGEIHSKELFGYGTYEFVMRVASTSTTPDGKGDAVSGSVSAAFNFVNDSETEIDFEFIGNDPGNIHLTHYNTTKTSQTEKHPMALSYGFHAFGFVWYPGHIEYYIDGKLISTHTKNVPSTPAHIVINHWGTHQAWGGNATPGVTRYMYVKSVKFTPWTAK
jgi:endo-1,3-1,4-beta-glycanase ExoK